MTSPSVGQTIYVHRYFPFKGEEPNLTSFVVTDVTDEFFAAVEQGAGWKQESRFDTSTWVLETDSYRFSAYRTEEEYWRNYTGETPEELRQKLISEVSEKDLPKLLDIKDCLED